MARTKNAARRGGAPRKESRDNPKRKREEAIGAEGPKRKENFPSTFQEHDQDRPSKKAKSTTTTVPSTSHQAKPTNTITSASALLSTNQKPQISPPIDITPSHQTTHLSILSSSPIQKKVARILSILSTFSFSDPSPHVVLLSAKAPSVCKLISIAEIVKRELAKTGKKWYQYNVVGELANSVPRRIEAEREDGGDVEMRDGEEEEEEEAFETMKTPFERALDAEGRPKMRALATLTLYLSRVRIESLKRIYGEQTNALT
ncbi:hypothetical protein DSL72_002105 [Monilinia vaccinii-corymbosi]|uniref:DNA/RNA-binding protein Alba-like domain-containing protein n=1 Tax=Monilinia vaccinii-corymbosi TaxID=61207 RepID=A0A8A3PBR8_9HELO|nr:hypothetical protein DSL72_002105 [Monilinia vaccinii-corymbosi]